MLHTGHDLSLALEAGAYLRKARKGHRDQLQRAIGLEDLVLDEPNATHSSLSELPLDQVLAEEDLARFDREGRGLTVGVGRWLETRLHRVGVRHDGEVARGRIDPRLALGCLVVVRSQ